MSTSSEPVLQWHASMSIAGLGRVGNVLAAERHDLDAQRDVARPTHEEKLYRVSKGARQMATT
ncbi:hypothetical protein [Bradyrhizobium sp. CCBAU 51753]|uniref:hypothetical protein n=1 Tax=Bradyrhizobium sp. CCBAU 51753 TaxID=1325100 RepID=UPI00188C4A21|nr:hypothetical protein [Bradyrhizobium sp. CCBAU 51753]QOZ23953.1 hypothetical protein XH93_10350 [Bradyrhizobium sp. CCBAU 51753]